MIEEQVVLHQLEKDNMNKNIKILFTGAQGTGKTSVMDVLPTSLTKLRGITRSVIENKNLTINEYSDNCTQKHIFDAYNNQLTSNDNYIAERSLIDVCAYTMYLVKHNRCSSTLLEYQISKLEKFIHQNENALYIYFPIEFNIIDDGTRSINKDFQKEVDNNIVSILNKYNLLYCTVSGNVDNRINIINKFLEENNISL